MEPQEVRQQLEKLGFNLTSSQLANYLHVASYDLLACLRFVRSCSGNTAQMSDYCVLHKLVELTYSLKADKEPDEIPPDVNIVLEQLQGWAYQGEGSMEDILHQRRVADKPFVQELTAPNIHPSSEEKHMETINIDMPQYYSKEELASECKKYKSRMNVLEAELASERASVSGEKDKLLGQYNKRVLIFEETLLGMARTVDEMHMHVAELEEAAGRGEAVFIKPKGHDDGELEELRAKLAEVEADLSRERMHWSETMELWDARSKDMAQQVEAANATLAAERAKWEEERRDMLDRWRSGADVPEASVDNSKIANLEAQLSQKDEYTKSLERKILTLEGSLRLVKSSLERERVTSENERTTAANDAEKEVAKLKESHQDALRTLRTDYEGRIHNLLNDRSSGSGPCPHCRKPRSSSDPRATSSGGGGNSTPRSGGSAADIHSYMGDDLPTAQELLAMARYLNMTLPEEEHLLWIAEEALCTPLPREWEAQEDGEGGTFFVNVKTGQTTSEHPCDASYRKLHVCLTIMAKNYPNTARAEANRAKERVIGLREHVHERERFIDQFVKQYFQDSNALLADTRRQQQNSSRGFTEARTQAPKLTKSMTASSAEDLSRNSPSHVALVVDVSAGESPDKSHGSPRPRHDPQSYAADVDVMRARAAAAANPNRTHVPSRGSKRGLLRRVSPAEVAPASTRGDDAITEDDRSEALDSESLAVPGSVGEGGGRDKKVKRTSFWKRMSKSKKDLREGGGENAKRGSMRGEALVAGSYREGEGDEGDKETSSEDL